MFGGGVDEANRGNHKGCPYGMLDLVLPGYMVRMC